MAESIYLIMKDSPVNEKKLISAYNKLYPELQFQDINGENNTNINQQLNHELGFTYLLKENIEKPENQYDISFIHHDGFVFDKILSFRLNKFYDWDKAYYHIFSLIFYILEEYPSEAVLTSDTFDDIGFSDGAGNLFLKKNVELIDLKLLEQCQKLRIEMVEYENEEEDGSFDEDLVEDVVRESDKIDVRVIDETDMKWFSDFIPPQFYQIPSSMETTFLGILLGNMAIGAIVMEQEVHVLNIHWIYIMPEYRRFHYASQALNLVQEKAPLLNAQGVYMEFYGTKNEVMQINQFLAYNNFTVNCMEYPVYHIFLEYLLDYPAFKKIADKKITSVIPLNQASKTSMKKWNWEKQKIKCYTKYPDYSLVSVYGDEIKGVLSGFRESDDMFVIRWMGGDTAEIILDLILSFIKKIEMECETNVCVKWIAADTKTEQLIKYLTGVTETKEQIFISEYEYVI